MTVFSARIGVDLGGTKIEAALINNAGIIVQSKRITTPSGSYRDVVEAIRDLVLSLENQAGARCSVGVATPGAISPATGLIKNANSTRLNGHKLDSDLAATLDRPIRLANDADCFALSEATDGAGAGAQTVFGTILGTGVGGGLVVRGKLLSGPNAIAGEWGHSPLPWPADDERPGAACYCGRRGCIETFLSGPSLSREHAEATGMTLSATEIAARAGTGDPAANNTLQRYEDQLARSLATVINLVDPYVIVLGGGLSRIARLYENVPRRWGRYVYSDTVTTKLLPPRYGDSSGVRGAAWLWGSGASPE